MNGRESRLKKAGVDTSRVPGAFVALPWDVLDCPGYQRLSYSARALLIDIARQHVSGNNGKLRASRTVLAERGWNSDSTINKATHELMSAGFLHQTVLGHRPNKASWFALTWYSLDKHLGYDAGAMETFKKGAYRDAALPMPKPKPSREELYARHRRPTEKMEPLLRIAK